MKTKNLLPHVTAPVQRPSTIATTQETAASVNPSWLTGDNNWGTPFASDGAE